MLCFFFKHRDQRETAGESGGSDAFFLMRGGDDTTRVGRHLGDIYEPTGLNCDSVAAKHAAAQKKRKTVCDIKWNRA
jgi:hypothetical protein